MNKSNYFIVVGMKIVENISKAQIIRHDNSLFVTWFKPLRDIRFYYIQMYGHLNWLVIINK